jgi:hypothetical protein
LEENQHRQDAPQPHLQRAPQPPAARHFKSITTKTNQGSQAHRPPVALKLTTRTLELTGSTARRRPVC